MLSDELAVAEELDFERKILPLLHIIFPDALQAPRRRSIDKSGIDLLVWGKAGSLPLAVQAKGFSVREAEVGSAQARQFVRSIGAFRNSGLVADIYLLVHNRDNRDPDFRQPVEDALRSLRTSGQAKRAELWSRQRLPSEAFQAMLQLLRRSICERNLSVGDLQKRLDNAVAAPLESVPYSRSMLTVDQYQLRSISPAQFCLGDPVNDVRPRPGHRFTILIGEFGSGKTTTVGRAVTVPMRQFSTCLLP